MARKLSSIAGVTGFGLVAVVLLWSDRAGSGFGKLLYMATRLVRRTERRLDINIVDRSDIPAGFDDIGHAVFWATGMIIIGWALRRRLPLLATAALVSLASVLFEATQPLMSTYRALEFSDIVANLIGVAIGTVGVAVLLAWHREVQVSRAP